MIAHMIDFDPIKRFGTLALTALILAGCSGAPIPNGIEDPHEARNRQAHERAIRSDETVLRPVSNAYGNAVPDELRRGISNVSSTLGLPADILNNVLQLRIGEAAHNTVRLGVNLTLGFGGLFDTAAGFGLEKRDTDFGQTLHAWGVEEGAYLVVPLAGPSTERDALGMAVDLLIDPLGPVANLERYALTVPIHLGEKIDSRYRYAALLDPVLYESADGYAVMRVTYLDNRRFELRKMNGGSTDGDAAADTSEYDIYEDFYD